jgi:tetratricopeptide (TPR) repeat protein
MLVAPALLALAIFAAEARAASATICANNIERALKQRQLDAAVGVWESAEEDILKHQAASIRVAAAFLAFGGCREAMQYQEIPEECCKITLKCLEAAGAKFDEGEGDDALRLRLARLYHGCATILYKRGVGDKAEIAEKGALKHAQILAEAESPKVEALLLLGELRIARSRTDPVHARDHLTKAGEIFERARLLAPKDKALLQWCAMTALRQAEILEEEVERKSERDRGLLKELKKAYEEALKQFQVGLKGAKDDERLKTGYNRCVWRLMVLGKGRCRAKPLLRKVESRYKKLRVSIPDSAEWTVKPKGELEEDEVLQISKIDRKAGQYLVIWVERYRWDYNYSYESTGEVIGGDNISGLAKRSYRGIRDIFDDIKSEKPLRKAPLSRRIKKAFMYRMEGRSKENNLLEVRVFFFKHSKVQQTFEVVVVADLGMLAKNPYELKTILNGFETVER